MMFSYAGKTALITGASSGIGEAFAQILAGRGMNLVLVARSADKLHTLAQQLSEPHGIRADVVPAVLSKISPPGRFLGNLGRECDRVP